ncbi:MAG TPA: 4Fe-4S dicluster domain-containing protein [Bacteroidales bacterium]|nr:4Fe-4S dicluster domain-containing protein [Bacteroidales bacterium]
MNYKIQIDLMKCRTCSDCSVDCSYDYHPDNNGMKYLLEKAVFSFTCRRCEDAPCIEVCPVDALEKDSSGILTRATNLCIACKSCVTICPFGTMLNSFFEVRKSICNYCHLNGEVKKLLCVETCKEHALTITEKDENPDENIHRLNDKVLVKEFIWEKLKHE